MTDNPYSKKVELTQEQWENILGKYRYEEVENPEEVWKKIKHLNPYEVNNSLHIIENCFELDGVKYRCLWAISSDDELPFEISTIHPQRQLAPKQLDLDI